VALQETLDATRAQLSAMTSANDRLSGLMIAFEKNKVTVTREFETPPLLVSGVVLSFAESASLVGFVDDIKLPETFYIRKDTARNLLVLQKNPIGSNEKSAENLNKGECSRITEELSRAISKNDHLDSISMPMDQSGMKSAGSGTEISELIYPTPFSPLVELVAHGFDPSHFQPVKEANPMPPDHSPQTD
jgi:hypothetical protein